jgi:hypothetical protein
MYEDLEEIPAEAQVKLALSNSAVSLSRTHPTQRSGFGDNEGEGAMREHLLVDS